MRIFREGTLGLINIGTETVVLVDPPTPFARFLGYSGKIMGIKTTEQMKGTWIPELTVSTRMRNNILRRISR
jgi:hypothetical protein